MSNQFRICQTAVLFGMAVAFFCRAECNAVKDNSSETVLRNDIVSDSVETMETERMKETTEEAIERETETEMTESEMSKKEEAELEHHYGIYRITKYYPTIYSAYSALPKQEADMLLGQTVEIKPEIFSVYDTKRWPNSTNDDYYFWSNYMIERYVEEKHEYRWTGIYDLEGEMELLLKPDDTMQGAVGRDFFYRLEGVITTRTLNSSDEIKPHMAQYYFYTIKEDADKLIMLSGRTLEYFLLERCEEEPEWKESLPKMSDRESREMIREVYGEYQVTEFLPTKFFPVWDGELYVEEGDVLPQEEASLMIGKSVIISEELFTTYDNYRLPTSRGAGRLVDDYWIKKKEIEKPDYQIRTVPRDEIYGIRDGMLPENLELQEYVEVDVYPGYEVNDGCKYLPQMYLAGEGKILLLAMGEYFLMEKTGNMEESHREASGDMPDLSGWVGSYIFSEESGDVKTKNG